MSILDDFLDLNYDIRQQRQIEELQMELSGVPDHRRVISELLTITTTLSQRIDKLELLNRALLEIVVAKQLTTAQEVDVLMQQVDLLDGVEDGKISTEVHQHAPKCGACHRYINPQRAACVYCGHAVSANQHQPEVKKPKPVPKTSCTNCAAVVPQSSTYYIAQGVVCEMCFVELGE